jgi:surface polysaccharide O-acyltransferase-like enzyme
MNQLKKTAIKKNDDIRIAWLVAALWSYSIITLLINTIVNFVFPNTPLDTLLCYGIVMIFVLLAIKPIVKRLKIKDIMFLLIILFMFFLSILFYPDNFDNIIDIFPRFFLSVFPYYFLGRAIRDFEILNRYLSMVSKYVISAAVVYYLITLFSAGAIVSDNMSFSYFLLPSVLFMLFVTLEDSYFKNWIFSALGIIVTIMAGTRGPLVCILAFCILYFLLNYNNFKTLLKYIPLFALGVFVTLSNIFTEWLTAFNVTMLNYGINLRIIQKFLLNDLLNSSGRDILQEMIINGIKKQPLQGYGLMGDRNVAYGFADGMGGSYAHNILLELLCQYGVILGSILILLIFTVVLGALIAENNRQNKHMIAILISLGLIKLFMSGSYLLEPYFFLLLGISVNSLKLYKNNNTLR